MRDIGCLGAIWLLYQHTLRSKHVSLRMLRVLKAAGNQLVLTSWEMGFPESRRQNNQFTYIYLPNKKVNDPAFLHDFSANNIQSKNISSFECF